MLPHDQIDKLPKKIRESVWRVGILKQGLGGMTSGQMGDWFAENPEVERLFYLMNRELENKIIELQERAINILKCASLPEEFKEKTSVEDVLVEDVTMEDHDLNQKSVKEEL